jgi:hypothetical protein
MCLSEISVRVAADPSRTHCICWNVECGRKTAPFLLDIKCRVRAAIDPSQRFRLVPVQVRYVITLSGRSQLKLWRETRVLIKR